MKNLISARARETSHELVFGIRLSAFSILSIITSLVLTAPGIAFAASRLILLIFA